MKESLETRQQQLALNIDLYTYNTETSKNPQKGDLALTSALLAQANAKEVSLGLGQ